MPSPARIGRIALLAAAAAMVALPSLSGAAADGGGDDDLPRVEVRPARIAFELDPGERRVEPVTVTNRMPDAIQAKIEVIDLEAGVGGAFARPAETPPARSAAKWVTVGRDSVDLQPGDAAKIDAAIAVPADAAPGAYAVALVASQTFGSISANQAEGVGTRVRARADVGSTIVILVSGDAKASARIVSTSSPRLVWGSKVPVFRTTVENDGMTLLKLEAATELSSFGAFAKRDLKSSEHPTLPGGRRRLEMHWTDRPWIGWFEPKLVVVGGDGSGVRVEQTLPTVFVLPPWWVVALLVAALLVPIVSGRRRRRRLREARDRRRRVDWDE